jgi:MATE family multidrug resistance protein
MLVLQKIQGWWKRPAGGREVVAMALPLVVSTSLTTVMYFTDRMFLLWHSNAAMAASLPAGLLHFTLLCFPLGLVSYVSTFVAQYYGAGRQERIGAVFWQGVWISLAVAPLYLASVPLAAHLFRWAGHEPAVAVLETEYYRWLTLGAAAALLGGAQSAFFTGIGATRVVMVVDGVAAVSNIALDYAWIFGRWGFPAAGIAGAALATVVSQWLAVVLYAAIMGRRRFRRPFAIAEGFRYDRELLGRLLRFGSPAGLQMFLDLVAFTVFLLLLGRLGEDALTATNLAFNVNTLAFMPMLGMGIAVSALVGQHLGADRPDLATRATWTAFWIALTYMGSIAVAYVAVPDLFLIGHAWGTDPARFATLRTITVVLLRFVAAYCLFDAMNVVFAGAIKGAGDTRFVLATAAAMAPLPVLASWLGMRYFGWGLLACWTTVTLWICAMGLAYLGRFLQGRWRHMRVIEFAVSDTEIEADEPAEQVA